MVPEICILVLFSALALRSVEGLACTNGQKIGDDPIPAATYFAPRGAINTELYLMGTNYKIGCCGVLTEWNFHAVLDSSSTPIVLQVYRYNPTTSVYDVVSQTSKFVSATERDSVVNVPLLAHERFIVKPDDLLGWSAGADIMGIIDGSVPEGKMVDTGTTLTTLPQSEDFDTNGIPTSGRPGLQVIVNENSAPKFKNVPATKTFKDEVAKMGYVCETLEVEDSDDLPAQLTVTMDTASTEFEYDSTTKECKLKVDTGAGTYPLQFTVQDFCGNKDTQTLTCVITNSVPKILNLPHTETLPYNDAGNKEIFVVSVSESSTCTIDSTTPTSTDFTLTTTPGTTHSVSLNAAPSSLAAAEYVLSITCTDGDGGVSTPGKLTFRRTPNAPPVWDNGVFPDGKSVPISAATIATADDVFKVAATDTDSTDLKFNATIPAGAPFIMLDSGQIKMTRAITLEKTPAYDLEIYVNDGTTVVGPRILTVTISDINEIPTFPKTSASVQVPEDAAARFNFYTIKASDKNGDKLTYTMTSDPATGTALFEINKNGQIKLKNGANIDYEGLIDNNYKLTVTASDGQETSEEFVLTVDITNVNEKPEFSKNTYSATIPEGTKMGDSAFLNTVFSVTDPDSHDKLTYSLDSGCLSDMLRMDETTGDTSYTGHYDVDNPTLKTTSPSNCIVRVKDKAGLADSAWLKLTVTDVNDVTPDFDKTSYTFSTPYTTTAGTTVGRVNATDLDLTSPNKDVTYTASAGCGVRSDGSVYPTINLSTYNKKVLTCTVTATDNGSPKRSASVPVSIILTTPTTNNNNNGGGGGTIVTTSSPISHSIFTGANIAWWVLLGLALLGLLTAVLCVAIRYCHRCRCRNICKKNPKIRSLPKAKPQSPLKTPPKSPRTITPPTPAKPVTPPRPKTPPDGSMWDFWSDANYVRPDIAYK